MKCGAAAAAFALAVRGTSATVILSKQLDLVKHNHRHHHHRHHFHLTESDTAVARSEVHFGDTNCPCIGFDNIQGETLVTFEDGNQASYPADLGARCEAWDDGRHTACKEGQTPGIGNGWCAQTWCYVDACNCNLPTPPKTSTYIPDARYRGRPIFYSYETCGSKDLWAKEIVQVGSPGCRCIGFDNVPGTTDVTIQTWDGENRVVSYPAEIGGSCQAWDQEVHPECRRGKDSAPWCSKKWCYVDPCSCDMLEPPKVTMYLPAASFTGKSLYYSYETCGEEDLYTDKWNKEACVNQNKKKDCLNLTVPTGGPKCAWTGTQCLGWELVEHPLCKGMVKAEKGPQEPPKNDAVPVTGGVAAAASMTLLLAGALAL